MIAEEIIENELNELGLSFNEKLIPDNIDIQLVKDAKKAIMKAMDDYAKQMCDLQKHECQVEMNALYSIQDEEGRWYISCDDILNAPYPRELQ